MRSQAPASQLTQDSLPRLGALLRLSRPELPAPVPQFQAAGKAGDFPSREEKKSMLPDEKAPVKELFTSLVLSKEDYRAALGGGIRFGRGTFTLAQSASIVVNSAAGKYIQFFNTSQTNLPWQQLSSAAEFSTLDVLFDEVFVHSCRLVFKPRNGASANYSSNAVAATAAGEPGQLNTCIANIYFLPHSAPVYTDNSSTFQNSAIVSQHKIVDLGRAFKFVMLNPERFDWRGPLADQTSTASAMGWMIFGRVSTNLGGNAYMATPVASGAAAGLGTLTEGGVFGDYMIYWKLSVRSRA